MISPAQVQEFLGEGVTTVDTPLREAETAAAAEALDRLLPFRPGSPGEKPRYRVGLTCSFFDEPLVDLIQHPFFEEAAKAVLDTDAVRFFQTAILASYPQPDTPFSFDQHVDIQYCAADFQATPRRIVCSFFLWLTEVDERRAPLMFRPGSHLLLARENERRGAEEGEVRAVKGVSLAQLPDLGYAAPVPLLARAGQASVLTTSAVHGASVNVGSAPRKAMVLTFTAAGVEIGLPTEQEEQKQSYARALRPLFRPERRHLLAS
jgi:ectoine hydroxylase-related dioxygenase (phytanoyl-CoA dioxygenase family)